MYSLSYCISSKDVPLAVILFSQYYTYCNLGLTYIIPLHLSYSAMFCAVH
jgi:hypothetical protein